MVNTHYIYTLIFIVAVSITAQSLVEVRMPSYEQKYHLPEDRVQAMTLVPWELTTSSIAVSGSFSATGYSLPSGIGSSYGQGR
jgi:hypothetical protein